MNSDRRMLNEELEEILSMIGTVNDALNKIAPEVLKKEKQKILVHDKKQIKT
jgi:DNA-binding FrmR family transcriptional regulator